MLRAGEMIVRDTEGIIAFLAYGPDDRMRLPLDTDAAFFGAWCPRGDRPHDRGAAARKDRSAS